MTPATNHPSLLVRVPTCWVRSLVLHSLSQVPGRGFKFNFGTPFTSDLDAPSGCLGGCHLFSLPVAIAEVCTGARVAWPMSSRPVLLPLTGNLKYSPSLSLGRCQDGKRKVGQGGSGKSSLIAGLLLLVTSPLY